MVEQKMKVLEIGCGRSPAHKQGGKLFKNNDVIYAGLDLPSRFAAWQSREYTVGANAARIPFRDDSFDYILMKSVFGQFMDHVTPTDIDDIRTWGMCESFRTLKPGGQIAVVEENTPWDIRYVESYLKNAGFQPTDYAESTDDKKKWKKLRSKFYNDSTLERYQYVMVAKKPDNPSYITISADINRHPFPSDTMSTFTLPSREDEPWREKIATVVYKAGKPNKSPKIVPRRV